MKVNTKNAPVAQATGATSFGQLLEATRPPSPKLVAASARALNLAAKSLAQAAQVAVSGRARVDAEASRLRGVRALHMVHAQQLVTTRSEAAVTAPKVTAERAIDAITQELLKDLEGTTCRAANDLPEKAQPRTTISAEGTDGRLAAPSPAQFKEQTQTRAAQAVALIEKIELFVKGAVRPALALTLNNSLGARVEIERIGPQEVALKLIGHRGPPPPEAVGRIREALHARGLRLAAVSVA